MKNLRVFKQIQSVKTNLDTVVKTIAQSNMIFVFSHFRTEYVDPGGACIRIFYFLATIVKFIFRAHHIGGSYRPILLIFNSKHQKTNLYIFSNFVEHQSKIATLRVPWSKKNGRYDVIDFDIKRSEKNICQITCEKFHQNWHIRFGCRDDTGTQTDTRTHRYPRFDCNILSRNLTEYGKTSFHKICPFQNILISFSRCRRVFHRRRLTIHADQTWKSESLLT